MQSSEMALFEHQFWLQILGDHSRFIFFSLAPTESIYIQKAQDFIILFAQLLELSRTSLSQTELDELNKRAYELTNQLRTFKLELLSLTLRSEIKVHLSSSFFDDMLNELEEYLFILHMLMKNDIILFHPIHYHMLWLSDAVGHSASVSAGLDMVEKDLILTANGFEKQFMDLYMKSLMMNGYLRTGMSNFPSLDRLNSQAGTAIENFMEFLEGLRDQRLEGRVLGTILPLMADHMAREECYYLFKLSQLTRSVREPDCDPARPRMKS